MLSLLRAITRRSPSIEQAPRMCVYRIVNRRTGGIYVGSSTNFPRRVERHLEQLRERRHPNYKLQADFDHYGEAVFRFEVLEAVSDRAQLLAREQHYLDTVNPFYNIARYAGRHPRYGRMPATDEPMNRNRDQTKTPGDEISLLRVTLAACALGLALLTSRKRRS